MTDSKPMPVPDELSAGFWASAANGVLAIQRCGHCGRYAHPPRVVCAGCQATDVAFSFEPVSGHATVRSWTVMRSSFLPGYSDDLPYVLVDVELDEHPSLRMVATLVDGPSAALSVGDRVEVAFADRASGVRVPTFRLMEGAK